MRGVYQIKNLANGKVYIGSSVHTHKRLISHISELKTGKHKNTHLLNAYIKYGRSSFTFEVIETLNNADVETLLAAEQKWIDKLHSSDRRYGYNLCPRADGAHVSEESRKKMSISQTGRRHTPETIEKCRRVKLGKKRAPFSQEWKTKLSQSRMGALNPMYHKTHTPEVRKLLSKINKGHRRSPATEFKKGVASWKGRKHSEQSKLKNRLAHIGRPSAMKGKRHTPEAIEKNRLAHLGKTVSPETRAKLSAAGLRWVQQNRDRKQNDDSPGVAVAATTSTP